MFIYGMFTSPRFLLFFTYFCLFAIWLIAKRGETKYSEEYNSVDAIVPAFNEEVTIVRTVTDLLENKYINKVIVVDDGSTDNTSAKIKELQEKYDDKLKLIVQQNTGKAGAVNNGLNYVETKYVFLTDADIRIPNNNCIGYLIQALNDGADAVTGIPGSDTNSISIFGKIRASVKISFATIRKCGGEIAGGNLYCISGCVGMYKTQVIKSIKLSGRTRVEDLDLSWELISQGYKITQSIKAIVFSQEAATFMDDLKRWRRWISGYAVCMRFHKGLLIQRIGLACILPNFIISLLGAILIIEPIFTGRIHYSFQGIIMWSVMLFIASVYTAYKNNKCWSLILFAPFSIIIIFVVCFCWIRWGLYSLITGKEANWNKVKRY